MCVGRVGGGEEPESNLVKANNRTCHSYILSSLHDIHPASLLLVKTLWHRKISLRKIPRCLRLPLPLSDPAVPHIVHWFHCQRRRQRGWNCPNPPKTRTPSDALKHTPTWVEREASSPRAKVAGRGPRGPHGLGPLHSAGARCRAATYEKTVGARVVLRNTQFTNAENPSFSKIRPKRLPCSTFLTCVITRPRWYKFSL